MSSVITELPSSGGNGSRLKVPRSKFSEKKIASAVSTKLSPLLLDPPRCSQPYLKLSRSVIPAINIKEKFAAGPARAIHAARRG